MTECKDYNSSQFKYFFPSYNHHLMNKIIYAEHKPLNMYRVAII